MVSEGKVLNILTSLNSCKATGLDGLSAKFIIDSAESIVGPLAYIVNLSVRSGVFPVDWRQCGNSLALCYFAVVMELPDSLLMNCKSEFGVIFLRCSPI